MREVGPGQELRAFCEECPCLVEVTPRDRDESQVPESQMVLKDGVVRPSCESFGLLEDPLRGVELVLVLERRREPEEHDHE